MKKKIILMMFIGMMLKLVSKNFVYAQTIVKEWTKQLGTASTDGGLGVATDSLGNIYVTGWTFGGLDSNTSAGGSDIFLVKYDSSGNKLWTKQLGTGDNDIGYGVATDGLGDIYVAGTTGGGLDGNTNTGSTDIFLVKYDSSGNKLWTKQLGTADADHGNGIATDSSGNIYITGYTSGGLDGNTNTGGTDIFLVKYDSSGNKLWTRQLGTADSDIGYGVASDSSSNTYVAGITFGGLDGNTNAGNYDLFLVKYSSDGVKQWTRQFGTPNWDYGEEVTMDNSSNIYVTGETSGGLDGNTNTGGTDIFLVKYDSSGNKLWTRQLGSTDYDYSRGVTTDNSSNIYVTGYTAGGLDGNTNIGGWDLFLSKYKSVPTGTICGKVTKSDGITGISGAVVEVLKAGDIASLMLAMTENLGNYSVTIATGTYDMRASTGGYQTQTKTGIVVYANQTTTVDFILVSTTPVLGVSPTSLSFGEIVKGQSKTLSFTITNSGGGTLTGNITANQTWLSISPTSFSLSTGTSVNISVTVSPTRELSDNVTYTGTLSITSNGGNATVSVSMIPTCAIAFPEPISLSSGKELTFWGTGVAYGTIRIYTLTGELVKELRENNGNDKITWDLTNENGERIVRGIYLYTATNPKEPKGNRGKFTVVK